MMVNEFDLNIGQLTEIADQMANKVTAGLNHHNQEIACLPTYVPVSAVPQAGRALVLDLGGTNARAAIMTLREGRIIAEKRTANVKFPWQSGIKVARRNYLDFLFKLLASLNPPDNLPLGYCFSFPTDSQPDGDARLIEWTKEVFVENTVGQPVGSMLVDHLHQHKLRCSKVTVINDTVATLLSSLTGGKADFHIGLIVGTGTNSAAIMESRMIAKLKAVRPVWQDRLPVNLESGNFDPPYLTQWDAAVDQASENPGQHRFEKAVSGAYLGHLFKAVFPDCGLSPDAGSEEICKLSYESSDRNSRQAQTARQIIARSAKLVAAALAGLVTVLNPARIPATVNICAEGGLIGNRRSGYGEMTAATLKLLLGRLGLADTVANFDYGGKDANLKGSALAVLAG